MSSSWPEKVEAALTLAIIDLDTAKAPEISEHDRVILASRARGHVAFARRTLRDNDIISEIP